MVSSHQRGRTKRSSLDQARDRLSASRSPPFCNMPMLPSLRVLPTAIHMLSRDVVRDGVAYGYLTSLIVVFGVVFGREMLRPPAGRLLPTDAIAAMAQWD